MDFLLGWGLLTKTPMWRSSGIYNYLATTFSPLSLAEVIIGIGLVIAAPYTQEN